MRTFEKDPFLLLCDRGEFTSQLRIAKQDSDELQSKPCPQVSSMQTTSAQQTVQALIVLHPLRRACLCCVLASPGSLQKPWNSLLEPLLLPGHLVRVSISETSLSSSLSPALHTGGRSNSLAGHTGPFKSYLVTLLLPASCPTAPHRPAPSVSLGCCLLFPLHSTCHTQKVPGADQMASFIRSLLCIFRVPSMSRLCAPVTFSAHLCGSPPHPDSSQPLPSRQVSVSPEHGRDFLRLGSQCLAPGWITADVQYNNDADN